MPASAERVLAREVVTRVRERSAYAHETLDAMLQERDLPRSGRAFATRLAYGTISTRGTLDEAVAFHLSPDVKLQSLVADCLAVSAHEILFMRTPARAAVNEGVELVKAVAPRASSLANAVLRRLAERASDFPWGDPATDIGALARLTGHPVWIVERLVSELGHDRTAAVLGADNEPAPLFLAHMPFRADLESVIGALEADGAEPELVEGLPGAIRCREPQAAVRSAVLADGRAIVIDAGAQFAAAAVPLSPGGHFVEIGAGRGSKTILMAARASSCDFDITLTAVDSHSFKLDALSRSAATVGAKGISSVTADATVADATGIAPGSIDALLIDAPCSGLGTLRRHPDRRWRARPEEVDALASLGSTLLKATAALVKPGGFVVYSTCTIVRAENDEVIADFLGSDEGSSFAVDPIGSEGAPESWAPFFSAAGTFLSLPSPDGPDGHYVARLRRRD